jgi:phage-related baseplate assembly protein
VSALVPEYLPVDPQPIVDAMVAEWERLTEKTLYPAQVERLLINNMAYREALLRGMINQAARQNLVRFATGPILDYLGELISAPRLAAQYARTRVRVTFEQAATTTRQINAGTLIQSGDGQRTFQTEFDVPIAPGNVIAEADATCVDGGLAGNGYVPGTLTELLDVLDASCSNITVSSGGADAESDEAYRGRLLLAPAGFSVAGPADAYVYLARSAHQSVIAVQAVSPAPAEVDVYVLTDAGAPDAVVLDLVSAKLSDQTARPLGIAVRVHAAPVIEYQIVANITALAGADPALVQAQALARINQLLHLGVPQAGADPLPARELQLGVDIVPMQISSAISGAGVYDIELISPAARVEVQAHQWAHCTGVQIAVTGVRHG